MDHPTIRELARQRIEEIETRMKEIDRIGIFDDEFNAGRRERDRLEREALTLAREGRLGIWDAAASEE